MSLLFQSVILPQRSVSLSLSLDLLKLLLMLMTFGQSLAKRIGSIKARLASVIELYSKLNHKK